MINLFHAFLSFALIIGAGVTAAMILDMFGSFVKSLFKR